MTAGHRLARMVFTVVACVLGGTSVAVAQDRDTQEVNRYVLTEPGLAKFTQATQNLASIPGACAKDDDDGSNSQTIDQMVAKLNAVPGAQAGIQSAGMTTREYVVFTLSMFQTGMASWAASQPGGKLPPGVSQANVDFVRKHEARLAALGANDPCNDDAAEEDEEVPEE